MFKPLYLVECSPASHKESLERIEQHRGWYLEHGYIESGKAKAIIKLVNKLCQELRPQAVPLVNAFGIPLPVLDAPIAR